MLYAGCCNATAWTKFLQPVPCKLRFLYLAILLPLQPSVSHHAPGILGHQASADMTTRRALPLCSRSKALLISVSLSLCVMYSSTLYLPSMYPCTSFGTSTRDLYPPKAVPRHTRPASPRNSRNYNQHKPDMYNIVWHLQCSSAPHRRLTISLCTGALRLQGVPLTLLLLTAFLNEDITPPHQAARSAAAPVTSWKGRVLISLPAAATPITTDWPQPLWQHSSAARITCGAGKRYRARC